MSSTAISSRQTYTVMELLDVSGLNGPIDYAAVRDSGISGAYIRAGLGLGTPDTALHEHANGFRAVGLPFGLYLVVYPRHGRPQDADAQADELARAHAETGATLKMCGDFERSKDTAAATPDDWLAALSLFAGTLRSAHGPPLIYAGRFFLAGIPHLSELLELHESPLWVPNYAVEGAPVVEPAPIGDWGPVTMLQYAGGKAAPGDVQGRLGTCPGVTGYVDRSRLTEGRTLDDLRA
jgi:GH25 family lysozyme M1 (1,4-beta-N-acetylmuramidase)